VTDFSIEPGGLAPKLDTVFSQLDHERFVDALWSRRADLWSGDYAAKTAIANRLGWLGAVDWVQTQLPHVESFVQRVRAGAFTDVVLFGMGGSSLAPEVFHRLFGRDDVGPRFRMLDSTDPAAVRDALGREGTSLFIVASKSGTTIEPNSMAAAARRRVESAGIKDWAELKGKPVCATSGAWYNKDVAKSYGVEIVAFDGSEKPLFAMKQGNCIGYLYDQTFLQGNAGIFRGFLLRQNLQPHMAHFIFTARPRAHSFRRMILIARIGV